ncbi:unnamed protein product, partial [Bubo scandiacus]
LRPRWAELAAEGREGFASSPTGAPRESLTSCTSKNCNCREAAATAAKRWLQPLPFIFTPRSKLWLAPRHVWQLLAVVRGALYARGYFEP